MKQQDNEHRMGCFTFFIGIVAGIAFIVWAAQAAHEAPTITGIGVTIGILFLIVWLIVGLVFLLSGRML